MADRLGRSRDRVRRAYRSLPPSLQNSLASQARVARRVWRNPASAPPSSTLPMHGEIAARERASLLPLLDLLAATGIPHFFIPAQEPGNLRLALPVERRGDLLEAMARGPWQLAVSWPGRWHFRSVASPDAVRVARDAPQRIWIHPRARVANIADARDVLRAVSVEFWEPDGRGAHRGVLGNPYSSAVRFDAPMVTVRARTGDDLRTFPAFATRDISDVTFPVDAVYLWVDDADPRWRTRRDETLRELGVTARHESAAEARFRQHDELRYSLRSLSQFAPWIRHVYLVTDQQVPDWLDKRCPRISVVDHRELFGSSGRLPTFNSHALAARLHHIEGLADHYLYLNDDVFFGRRTGAELWFEGNGQPRCHFTRTTPDPADVTGDSPLVHARQHTYDLIEQLTGRLRRRNLQHGPHAMSREVMAELERALPEEFERTWSSQLRSATDFVPERLHSQVGHAWGRALDGRGVRYKYFNVGQPEAEWQLQAQLDSRWADTFCLNDAEGPVPPETRGTLIRDFLSAYYPTPSEFEL